MKHLLLFLLLTTGLGTFAQQQEFLAPMGYNPKIQAQRQTGHQHKYLVDKSNTVVQTATLNLPFVDDFSRNRTRSYKWVENHITASYTNVFGTCLSNEGIATPLEMAVSNQQAYTYSYDTATHTVDSVALNSVQFTFFGPATTGCFDQAPSSLTYWPAYYSYTFDNDGKKIDSVYHFFQTIQYAPLVNIAQGEPGTLWFDNYAFVNNTYPVNPPTIGVATLDGLNDYGLPYNNASSTTYGDADYLTSLPINLQGKTEADSIYLSFFYEPKGLGDYPNLNDSLLVEFKDNSSIWRQVWFVPGDTSSSTVKNEFKQVLVLVPALPLPYDYYYNGFQFRFHNKASLYGNLDHWHIDYVQLNSGRNAQDTVINDVAFVYDFPTILKDYTLLPADQFQDATDMVDTVHVLVHNLDPNAVNNPPATNFVVGATELYPSQAIVATDVLQTFNASPDHYIDVFPSADYQIPHSPNWPVDSLVLASRLTLDPNDALPQNDTLIKAQTFSAVMAYDDGSAEAAYGVAGLGTKKFAYEFNVRQPDTLVGFQVMFSQVEGSSASVVFQYFLWDSLALGTYVNNEFPLWQGENAKPFYVDSTNGFYTFVLDTPIILTGSVFLGWTQSDDPSIQVGYDLNSTLGHDHMYVYLNGQWKKSAISTAGSPMMRLLFDTEYWGHTTSGIRDVTGNDIPVNVYPNPTTGSLTIATEEQGAYEYMITNAVGQQVRAGRFNGRQLNLSELPAGMYVLSLRNEMSGSLHHTKILKNTN
ncbi:MAG: T9SS type A sorting domain-containing protein [Chitinophagales bacterium]